MPLQSWLTRRLITRAARAHGFIDPIKVLARLRGFAQPSEIAEPLELVRAGFIFHARGLLNTKAIQNNLDWIWPFWVEKQFDPLSSSFIPRAFSFSHINLTHRNWTAVGLPGLASFPLVDPRGLVTPHFDGWSIDFWALTIGGTPLWPSKAVHFSQDLLRPPELSVVSRAPGPSFTLESKVWVEDDRGSPTCAIEVGTRGSFEGFLVVSLRPYNPEGISRLDTIGVTSQGRRLLVNGTDEILVNQSPARIRLSNYRDGDVAQALDHPNDTRNLVECPVGLATAGLLFSHEQLQQEVLRLRVPLRDDVEPRRRLRMPPVSDWSSELAASAKLQIDDPHLQRLYDTAVASLILHCPEEVYPGPFTYKRFWFRDAAFILNTLLEIGGAERVRNVLASYPARQRSDGYFLSQDGEWDSNGEALWMMRRFSALTGTAPPAGWLAASERGAAWILGKRLPLKGSEPTRGLLPAGFSAEHLGPNDFYYWDDFWGVAGLRAAADLHEEQAPTLASHWRAEADAFLRCIEASIPGGPHRRFPEAIPASPLRRMDSGAIGSLVADYPLRLYPPAHPRIMATVEYLLAHSSVEGAFFQNMIHSGVNPYLTLHLAQVLLRAGDVTRAHRLMLRVGALASPTGQWPEAIHPRTLGGCMGDGQHIWAAAEWIKYWRDCFVREEAEHLMIGAGLVSTWMDSGGCSFGPTQTPWGEVNVIARKHGSHLQIEIRGAWRKQAPKLRVAVPAWREVAVLPAHPLTRIDLEPAIASRP